MCCLTVLYFERGIKMNYESAKKMFTETRKRKLANNTYLVSNEDGSFGVRLHNTQVVKYYPDKTLLFSGGWHTVTTKQRINEYSNAGLYQKDFCWYIDIDGKAVDFFDGIAV